MKTKHFLSIIVLSILPLLAGIYKASAQIRNPKDIQQKWKTDTSRHTVPLNELTVVLKRNKIQPINDPHYINKTKALKELIREQPVIALEVNGKARAYPLAVLSFHEIVNDRIGGTPVGITYCPLCNSSPVFKRKVTYKGTERVLTLGTSGMLRKSNLVMWDEETETWWQQFTGKAIVGEMTGAKLEMLPSMVISMQDFLANYPNGKVLWPKAAAKDDKDYTRNVYTHYDSLGVKKPRLFFGKVDDRLPAMARVIEATNGDKRRVYPLKTLREEQVINDQVGNKPVVLFYDASMLSNLDKRDIAQSRKTGAATVFHASLNGKRLTFKPAGEGFRDKQTGSLWTLTGKCVEGTHKGKQLRPEIYGHHFAFAWFAFYPNSAVYQAKE